MFKSGELKCNASVSTGDSEAFLAALQSLLVEFGCIDNNGFVDNW